MPHISPIAIPGGRSLLGISLGFHAYSLRVDNLSNQWLQEQSSLAWIPPYSLGLVMRLYGTSTALILNQAPVGQPSLVPIAGEYAFVVYSDEYRSETTGVPVREFSLVQSVTDLTLGPQPATPITGVLRLWADPTGVLHRLMSTGADFSEIDTGTVLGGVLNGTLPNPGMAAGAVGQTQLQTGSVTSAAILDGSIQTVDIGNQQITSALIAPGAAASNVGSLGGALSGTLPNPSQVWQAVSLGVNVALAAGTWTTAINLNLIAGTYVIWAVAQFQLGAAAAFYEARIWDGVTVFTSGGTSTAGTNTFQQIALPPTVITPGGLTTYGLQGRCSGAGAAVGAVSPATAQVGATQMFALRLA